MKISIDSCPRSAIVDTHCNVNLLQKGKANMGERNWSAEQKAVFAVFASMVRNLVIRARAGTGKTTTILHGITLAIWARSILVCAFNKRIAQELQAKCQDVRATIKTLHAIGMGFITKAWGRVQVDGNREFALAQACDPTAPNEILALAAKLAQKVKELAHNATLQVAVDLAWRFECLPEERTGWTVEKVAELALAVCQASQKPCQAHGSACTCARTISFADMLYLPLVLDLVRPYWDLVVVDEAQDMSPSQIELAKRCVKRGGRVVVVGDDRQAIYGFRGADSGTIDALKAELGADELTLTTTYRCPKGVVALARELVPGYQAADSAPEGTIDTIRFNALVGAANPGDFILSRKNAPLMGVCLALLKVGKRAKIQGRDVGAGLQAIVRKLRARSIPEFLAKLTAWKDREIKRAEARGNGVGQSRIDTVTDQADMLAELAQDVRGVEELTVKLQNLFADVEGDAGGVVVCSSVHKAKGLEAGRVFVLRDTLYPGKRQDIEEQNIHYVAITRTQKHLTWVDGL